MKRGAERCGIDSLNRFRADLAIGFDQRYDGRFVLPLAFAVLTAPDAELSPDVGFINLNLSAQHAGLDVLFHRVSNAVGEVPSRAVAADSEIALKLQGADALLAAGHQVKRLGPEGQREVSIFHHGINSDRELALAVAAFEQAGPGGFALKPVDGNRSAMNTDGTVRPAKPFKIFPRLILRELRNCLALLGLPSALIGSSRACHAGILDSWAWFVKCIIPAGRSELGDANSIDIVLNAPPHAHTRSMS